jgi:hypothetical protein
MSASKMKCKQGEIEFPIGAICFQRKRFILLVSFILRFIHLEKYHIHCMEKFFTFNRNEIDFLHQKNLQKIPALALCRTLNRRLSCS